ncbi:uncharacterized protein LOC128178641 isoform X2 [Crassostrea angulata]|uniref:uncharacterized protein LOC128178641 isoform X2 n=1 Tax=Magallana angulata TaxID=2784310 RepID=UPI0022B14F65|nr:uncharacterized protein LOC128178641 isoform X2 [Crassostrea angulata]
MEYRALRKLAIVFGLVIHAQAEEFLVGTTLKLPCNIPESFSEFTWDKSATLIAEVKKGTASMATDPRVSVDTKENLGELSIRNIVEHDAGEYSCTVEFSNRLPQTTTYTVYIVDSTSKPPSTTTSTRVALSSTVSTDSTYDSTRKPPSTTTSTRVAQSSTVSTDSGTQSTNVLYTYILLTSKPPSTTTSTRVAVSSTVSTDSGTQSTNERICCCPCNTLPKDLAEEVEKMNLKILAYNEWFISWWENHRDRIGSNP